MSVKVLMFGWEFPPYISGGLGTACKGIVEGLIKNEVQVALVVPKILEDRTKPYRLIDAGKVPITGSENIQQELHKIYHYYEINSPIVPYLDPEDFSAKASSIDISKYKDFENKGRFYKFSGRYGPDLFLEVGNYAAVASSLALSEQFDIIHAHDWHAFPAGIMAKKLSKKPLIIHIHSTEFDRAGDSINKDIYQLEKDTMLIADHIITVSEFTKKILVDRYEISPLKISVIHNAIEKPDAKTDYRRLRKHKEKIVTYLGRITFQKGPEYFIEAAAKVLKVNRKFRFVMAGNGNMLYRMIDLASKHRISDHFHFTGFLNAKEVEDLLSISDAYVMPSVSEPFGLSALEATYHQIPSIISIQSGVQEVLDHSIKLDFWDTDAMANAIYAIGSYPSLSRTLVCGSQKELNHFDWDRQTFKIKHLYQQLINSCNTAYP
ncbi:glycosyltransferase family 4 protein [Echinicola shivajiensis]|uniref:glycosyltransferase family 4 protein n=1 Tax=Echinicola shivajiensis TaxID=1035916 RepID=UPI001BFBFE20|nr:glycosyltransferase family 4 protein [Echinicola shivajiensis]